MMNLDNNTTLSAEAKAVVEKFVDCCSGDVNSFDIFVALMGSLYRMRPNSNQRIISYLESDCVVLSKYLAKEEIEILQDEYVKVIELCYENIILNSRKYSAEYVVPSTLIDLFEANTNINDQSRIYLPYTGITSIFKSTLNCKYDGFELYYKAQALVQLYAESQGLNVNIKTYNLRDIISQEDNGQQYDYIFALPPWFVKKENEIVSDTLKFIVDKKLVKGGEMWCVFPMSFCFDRIGGWYRFKKYILDNAPEYSIQVLALPKKLYTTTQIPVCALRVIKDGKNSLELFDLSDDKFSIKYIREGHTHTKLNIEAIQYVLNNKSSKYSWIGNVDNLKLANYNIQPSANIALQNEYTLNKYPICDLVDIVDQVKLVRIKRESEEIPVIGMRELSFDATLCDIDYQDIPQSKFSGMRVLTEDCLLVGYMGGKFKVGHVKGLNINQYCAIRSEIHPIKVKSNIIREDYLRYVFLSEKFTNQANKFSTGVGITRISTDIFWQLKIECPSLLEQKQIIKDETKFKLSNSEQKLKESFDEYIHETHMKRHAMSQTISNLVNRWDIIKLGIQQGKITWDHDFMFDLFDESENDVLNDINNTILRLQMQITKFDPGYTMKEENVSLIRSINDYISKNKSAIFSYDFQKDDNWDKNFGMIKFSNDALILIFDNIKNNACYHGFKNIKSKDHVLKIELSRIGESYELLISNNGEALNSNMDEKKVLFYGESSKFNKLEDGHVHCGIGGYEVSKLMQKFGGTAEFISTPNEIFKVTYKLIFKNI